MLSSNSIAKRLPWEAFTPNDLEDVEKLRCQAKFLEHTNFAHLGMTYGSTGPGTFIESAQAFDCVNSSPCRRFGRAILTDEQAQTIYRHKPGTASKRGVKVGTFQDRAAALAKMYGISVKTVRDIWIGRTWYRATYHLDTSRAPTIDRLLKKSGRPKGSKDSKPRVRKVNFQNAESSDVDVIKLEKPETNNYQAEFSKLDPFSIPLSADDTFCEVRSEQFEDPFHDDWAFWTKKAELEADSISPK